MHIHDDCIRCRGHRTQTAANSAAALVWGPDGFVGCAGEPFEIKKAVCLHEEDAGIVWKHTELRTMHPESRRSRRLVISTMATVGVIPAAFHLHQTACVLMAAAVQSHACRETSCKSHWQTSNCCLS